MTTFSSNLTNLNGSPASSHMIAVASEADEGPHLRRSAETHWLSAHIFAHSIDLEHEPRLVNVTDARSWRLCGINLPINNLSKHSIWQFFVGKVRKPNQNNRYQLCFEDGSSSSYGRLLDFVCVLYIWFRRFGGTSKQTIYVTRCKEQKDDHFQNSRRCYLYHWCSSNVEYWIHLLCFGVLFAICFSLVLPNNEHCFKHVGVIYSGS